MDDTIASHGGAGGMTVPEALRQLIERYGSDLGADPRRVGALLRDLAGEHRSEIAAVVAAAEEGVPETLLSASVATVDTTMRRLVDSVARDRALTPAAAGAAVAAWATALGVSTLPVGATVAAVPGAGLDATQAAPSPSSGRASRPALPLPAILGGLAVLGLIAFGLTRLIGSGTDDVTTTIAETTLAGNRYPESVVAGFMEGCTGSGAPEVGCRCLIDGIQAVMPLEDFVVLQEADFARPPMNDIVVACSLDFPDPTTTTAATTTTTLAAYTFERVQGNNDQVSAEAPTEWGVAPGVRQVIAAADVDEWGAEYNVNGWKERVGIPGFRASLFPSAVTLDEEEAGRILTNAEIPPGCTLSDQISDGFENDGFAMRWLINDYECADGGRYSLTVEWEPSAPGYFIVFESYAVTQRDVEAVDRAFNTLSWVRP